MKRYITPKGGDEVSSCSSERAGPVNFMHGRFLRTTVRVCSHVAMRKYAQPFCGLYIYLAVTSEKYPSVSVPTQSAI
jgi:hypothetical protein